MVFNIILATVFVPAVIFMAYRFACYGFWRRVFDAMAPDGDAAGFTEALHANLSDNFFFVGLFLLALMMAGFVRREATVRAVSSVPSAWNEFRQDVFANLRCGILDIPWLAQLTLLGIIVIGAGLRLWLINVPLDFISETAFVELNPLSILSSLRNDWAIYHPIVPFGTKISTMIFGIDLWAVRLPTMVFGILLIPFTYWAGSILFEYRTGLIAAALTSVAVPLITYSSAVRGYAYGNLFLIGALALVPYLCRSKNLIAAILFTALCALAAFSVKSMLFGVVFCCLFFAVDSFRQEHWKIEKNTMIFGLTLGCLIFVMIIFLYSPYWIVNEFSDLINSAGYPVLGGKAAATPLQLLANQGAGLWRHWTADVTLPVLVFVIAGISAALLGNRRAQFLAGAILISHLPIISIIGTREPPTHIWQYLLPAIFLITASGIVRILSVAPTGLRYSFLASLVAIVLSLSGAVAAVGDESNLAAFREKPYRKTSLQGVADNLVSALKPGTLALSYYQTHENVDYYFHYFARAAEKSGFSLRQIPSKGLQSLKIARICPKQGACPENPENFYLFTDIAFGKALKLFSENGLPAPDGSRAERIHWKHSGLSIYRFVGTLP